MDEFGVLVESIGFKSQKSAPMARLKPKPKNNFSFNDGFQQSSSNSFKSAVWNESFVDDLDGIFQSQNNSNNSQNSQKYFDAGIDIFGGPSSNPKSVQPGSQGSIDLDSVFDFNTNSRTGSSSKLYDDMFPTESDAADDLLAGFGFNTRNLKKGAQGNASQMEDLIPGFGESSFSSYVSGNNGIQAGGNISQPSRGDSSNSTSSMTDDPFLVFESSKSATNDSSGSFSYPSPKNTERTSDDSSIDELEKFAMGKVPDAMSDKPSVATLKEIRISLNKKDSKATDNSGVGKVHRPEELLNEKQRENEREKVAKEKNAAVVNDSVADNIFDMGDDSSRVNHPRTQAKDPIFDALFNDNPGPKVHEAASQASHTKQKPSSVGVVHEDFHSLFGEAPSSSGAFQEIEGESEERRAARWKHHTRTQQRMAQALAEKNERDFQTQYEQEERRRLAETLDQAIKRWSAGKEGNLLALLSSLQEVLWPECGWQPVPLPNLINPVSMKKVYHKATLCVHPDKVQQKGSTLQQKYIAEKVFDLLKEAWNKHNTQGPQSSSNMNFSSF